MDHRAWPPAALTASLSSPLAPRPRPYPVLQRPPEGKAANLPVPGGLHPACTSPCAPPRPPAPDGRGEARAAAATRTYCADGGDAHGLEQPQQPQRGRGTLRAGSCEPATPGRNRRGVSRATGRAGHAGSSDFRSGLPGARRPALAVSVGQLRAKPVTSSVLSPPRTF